MPKLILYNYFRSSTSYRVRAALEIKKLSYTYKPIHLLNNGGEQNTEAYRKLNPAGGVPTLIHDDKIIAQSMAIIEYLDDAFPQTYQLFPTDVFQKAKVRQFCENINADMHALNNLKVLNYLVKNHNLTDDEKLKWSQHWIDQGFTALEKMAKLTAKDYCFGSVLTAADVLLIPQMVTAERFKADLSGYPTLNHIFKNCMQLPEFKKSHPFVQMDTPEELNPIKK
ncbi:MAG: maleylacetoacetate isomerase [Pseudobdellovibrio sp.]